MNDKADNEKKPYEKPKAVPFGSMDEGYANCEQGNVANDGNCDPNGGTASPGSCNNGGTAADSCDTGGGAGVNCNTGSAATGSESNCNSGGRATVACGNGSEVG